MGSKFDVALDGLRLHVSVAVQEKVHEIIGVPLHPNIVRKNRGRALAVLYNADVLGREGDGKYRVYILRLARNGEVVALYGRVEGDQFKAASLGEVAE